MVERAVLRVRQVKALYQRELTALNRDPNLDDDTRRARAERLWRQANDQIARLRQSVEEELAELSVERRAEFDPPKRPPYLSGPE